MVAEGGRSYVSHVTTLKKKKKKKQMLKKSWRDVPPRRCKLTFPVISNIRVPEVVADLMSCYTFDGVSCFKRIQDDAVLLHFSPVNLFM